MVIYCLDAVARVRVKTLEYFTVLGIGVEKATGVRSFSPAFSPAGATIKPRWFFLFLVAIASTTPAPKMAILRHLSPMVVSMLICACLVAASVASGCPVGTGTWSAAFGRDELEVSFGLEANATLTWFINTIPWCAGTSTTLSGDFQVKGTSGRQLLHLFLSHL